LDLTAGDHLVGSTVTVERKWDGEKWVVTGGGAEKHTHVTFSATEPVGPDAGDVWINPDESLSDSHAHAEYLASATYADPAAPRPGTAVFYSESQNIASDTTATTRRLWQQNNIVDPWWTCPVGGDVVTYGGPDAAYLVIVTGGFGSNTGGTVRLYGAQRNGNNGEASNAAQAIAGGPSSAGWGATLTGASTFFMTSGDWIEVHARQDSGTTLQGSCLLTLIPIGPFMTWVGG
jgi:hypothetical protein